VTPDVRLHRVVARAVLIAALASVVVPAVAGSRIPSAPQALDPTAFTQVDLARSQTTMTALSLDPANRSAGSLEPDGVLGEPGVKPAPVLGPRPTVTLPNAKAIVQESWRFDPNISWYGPGFYGHNGACGLVPGGIQKDTIGVAHRTLPCGTKVTFKYNGVIVVARVIDRGPYVAGRIFDMTHGLCAALNHCFTGTIWYRIG
jgi:rare lipoprotein A (peptidoglycan hydrolase)